MDNLPGIDYNVRDEECSLEIMEACGKCLRKRLSFVCGPSGCGRYSGQRCRPYSKDSIIYPESDGKPIADNTKQFRWIVKIKEGLEVMFADRPDVFVAGDLLWYREEGNNKKRMEQQINVSPAL